MIETYYRLTKPGIVYGNLLSAVAGFMFASFAGDMWPDIWLLIAMAVGVGLVIASGCVFNNYIDQDIDAKMTRTKKRALVTGRVTPTHAIVLALGLSTVGFALLAAYTNLLTVIIVLAGFIDYVIFYTFSKRHTVHSTLIGSICGAVPIVAGYTAVVGRLDLPAVLLFAAMVTWQMPHFYAISLYRKKDYQAASLPVLSVRNGNEAAKKQIKWYVIAFMMPHIILTLFDYTGFLYLLTMFIVNSIWLYRVYLPATAGDVGWARQIFGFSLVVLLTFSVALSLGALLP